MLLLACLQLPLTFRTLEPRTPVSRIGANPQWDQEASLAVLTQKPLCRQLFPQMQTRISSP